MPQVRTHMPQVRTHIFPQDGLGQRGVEVGAEEAQGRRAPTAGSGGQLTVLTSR